MDQVSSELCEQAASTGPERVHLSVQAVNFRDVVRRKFRKV